MGYLKIFADVIVSFSSMAYGLRFNRKGIDHATHELTTNIKKTLYNLVICEGFGSFGVIFGGKVDFVKMQNFWVSKALSSITHSVYNFKS